MKAKIVKKRDGEVTLIRRVFVYIKNNPGMTATQVAQALHNEKNTINSVKSTVSDLVRGGLIRKDAKRRLFAARVNYTSPTARRRAIGPYPEVPPDIEPGSITPMEYKTSWTDNLPTIVAYVAVLIAVALFVERFA